MSGDDEIRIILEHLAKLTGIHRLQGSHPISWRWEQFP